MLCESFQGSTTNLHWAHTYESISTRLQGRSSKLLNDTLLVRVDFVQAILDAEYFVLAVQQCETNLTRIGRHRLVTLLTRTAKSTSSKT